MFRLIVQLAISIRAAMAYAPSNLLVSRLRVRGGLGSALTAITVGAAYLFAAGTCTALLARGGPGWLNVFVLLFVWNAFKLVLHGPVMLVVIARQHLRNRHSRRMNDCRHGRSPAAS
jgi:hypothetical protein